MAELEDAKAHFYGTDNVVAVGRGVPFRNGQWLRGEQCLVVGVKEKTATREEAISRGYLAVPREFRGIQTDVVQFKQPTALAHLPFAAEDVVNLALTQRQSRPIKHGGSEGSVRVTAGTGTAAVLSAIDGVIRGLTNMHVSHDSGAGVPGDPYLQPGRADGGNSASDRTGSASQHYARINFRPDPKKNELVARLWWGLGRLIFNTGAAVFAPSCKNRLFVSTLKRDTANPFAVDQPTPNRIDAGLWDAFEGMLGREHLILQRSWADVDWARLNDDCEGVGRTQEYRDGFVGMVDGLVGVNYGTAGTADFDGQMGLVRPGGVWLQPGDSGTGVFRKGTRTLIGLGFAGGETEAFANQMPDVFRILNLVTPAPWATAA